MKQYKPIKPFNDHSNCKGHANWMLDNTYETQEDRDLLAKCLSNYIQNGNKSPVAQGKR